MYKRQVFHWGVQGAAIATITSQIIATVIPVSYTHLAADEGEIGYWLGEPFWGQGLIPEATKRLIRYAFEDCHLKKLWCGSFEGNHNSRRVQEKCGFHYAGSEVREWPLIHKTLTGHIMSLTIEEWRQTSCRKTV